MNRMNAVNRGYAQTMTTAEAKFREIEFSANRALAYAILAAEAPNRYLMFYRLLKLAKLLSSRIVVPSAGPFIGGLRASSPQRWSHQVPSC